MSDDISLLVLTNSLSHRAGGMFFSIREPRLELLKLGINVRVCGIRDDRTEQDISHWQPIPVQVFDSMGPRRFGFSPQLRTAVEIAEIDILHLHGLWTYASTIAHRWGQKTKKPVIVSPHGMLDSWAIRNGRWKKQFATALFERNNLKSSTCIHALNESEAHSIRELGYINPIAVIPNGVFAPIETTETVNRVVYTTQGRNKLLFLGRLHKKKGLSELIEAWRILKTRHSAVMVTWKLIIAGWDDGDFESALREAVIQSDLSDDVEFVGPVFESAKLALMESAGAFILPSMSEGLPMSVLEAWSFNIPTFITRECNLEDSFARNAAIEIMVAPEAMANVLESYLMDPVRLGAVANAGAALVSERYTWQAIAPKYKELYEWLVGRARRPEFVI
jgi:glycosyltransferase involved in cell wall biosynthesis